MKPLPSSPPTSGPPSGAPVSPPSPAVPSPAETAVPPRVTILSELDSYIAERMKEQPASLSDVAVRTESLDSRPPHRLRLPDYFERYSGDGRAAGPYIFRWIGRNKRSIDGHLAKGWLFVNRTFFPEAPRYLFTANGGVEVGDAILGFMPTKQALQLRAIPARLSQERLKGQMTQTQPDYVLMSGNPKDEKIYQPALGTEGAETSEEKVPGVLTEGRDF